MSAGMGDIVFAPLYQVLRRRGVRFEFFHRLRGIGLCPEETAEPAWVERLEFDVQAKVKGGGEYQPLVDVNRVPSWPSHPDYAQLANGRVLERQNRNFEAVWEERRSGTKTLLVQRDFDFLVLGVSIGALPDVARELVEREPRWRDMVRHVKTVPTQAFQIWMRTPVSKLGWNHPQTNLAGFVEPFDTWADMTHLIPEESWRGEVNSIAYFCSPLADPTPDGAPVTRDVALQQYEVVKENAVRFLKHDIASLWPRSKGDDGGFDWGALVGPESPAKAAHLGAKQFDTQFWT